MEKKIILGSCMRQDFEGEGAIKKPPAVTGLIKRSGTIGGKRQGTCRITLEIRDGALRMLGRRYSLRASAGLPRLLGYYTGADQHLNVAFVGKDRDVVEDLLDHHGQRPPGFPASGNLDSVAGQAALEHLPKPVQSLLQKALGTKLVLVPPRIKDAEGEQGGEEDVGLGEIRYVGSC